VNNVEGMDRHCIEHDGCVDRVIKRISILLIIINKFSNFWLYIII